MECPTCGHEMKTFSWLEEAWGTPIRVYDYECKNPNCGQEENEDECE